MRYGTQIGEVKRDIEAPTGDYRMIAVIAVALADAPLPCHVQVWSNDVMPDYGPYWYTVACDSYGRLRCAAQL